MNRIRQAQPGSAWDKWHKAGFDCALADDLAADQVERAAVSYFESTGFAGSNAYGAITRAFTEGATQALKATAL